MTGEISDILPHTPAIPIETVTKSLSQVFIVVKRVNGHFEPVSQGVIQSFSTAAAANAERAKLADKFHGSTFAVFALTGQTTLSPARIVEEVEEV